VDIRPPWQQASVTIPSGQSASALTTIWYGQPVRLLVPPGTHGEPQRALRQRMCGWPRRRIAPQALARFKSRVRELSRRNGGRSLARTVEGLARYLIGWRGYFGFCETPSVLRRLDQWVRRRLRCLAWQQWKRGPTRFAELRRRGVGKDLAARTAGSPHGPWRLSNSPALAIALPNADLATLGLPSLAAGHAA
jgi:RNA-directed DNA polymerase